MSVPERQYFWNCFKLMFWDENKWHNCYCVDSTRVVQTPHLDNNCIALSTEDRLYWADFGRGRVDSVEINGGDRRAHVEMVKGFTFIKPYGLALLGKENKIFYSDNTQSVILEIDQSQGSEREPITIEGATGQFQDLTHIFISEFSEGMSATLFHSLSVFILMFLILFCLVFFSCTFHF